MLELEWLCTALSEQCCLLLMVECTDTKLETHLQQVTRGFCIKGGRAHVKNSTINWIATDPHKFERFSDHFIAQW